MFLQRQLHGWLRRKKHLTLKGSQQKKMQLTSLCLGNQRDKQRTGLQRAQLPQSHNQRKVDLIKSTHVCRQKKVCSNCPFYTHVGLPFAYICIFSQWYGLRSKNTTSCQRKKKHFAYIIQQKKINLTSHCFGSHLHHRDKQ